MWAGKQAAIEESGQSLSVCFAIFVASCLEGNDPPVLRDVARD
jgi:hypothetical protein